jgi:hypothetical protein
VEDFRRQFKPFDWTLALHGEKTLDEIDQRDVTVSTAPRRSAAPGDMIAQLREGSHL